MRIFIKDPDAVLDYKIDWSAWLGTDTIATSKWSVEGEDITIDSDEKNDTETVVWLSGGEVEAQYIITNSITTVGGREDDRTIMVRVREK